MPDDLVYSTGEGRICPICSRPIAQCPGHLSGHSFTIAGDGTVRVGRETKGRKGKCVTVICGIPQKDDDLEPLAKQLKQKCGAGGTVRPGVIEIQGDHRALVARELTTLGFKVKVVGR